MRHPRRKAPSSVLAVAKVCKGLAQDPPPAVPRQPIAPAALWGEVPEEPEGGDVAEVCQALTHHGANES